MLTYKFTSACTNAYALTESFFFAYGFFALTVIQFQKQFNYTYTTTQNMCGLLTPKYSGRIRVEMKYVCCWYLLSNISFINQVQHFFGLCFDIDTLLLMEVWQREENIFSVVK